MAYLDTSLLVAYYCPEPLSAAAQRTIRRDDRPTISPLVEVELYSAVAAKVRARHLDRTTADQVLALFQQHVADARLGMVAIGEGEYALARNWLGRFATPLRALDALHLAAAHANDLTLVTADQALARSAKHLGVKSSLIS